MAEQRTALQGGDGGPQPPSLDFLSGSFDPLRALLATELQPPLPRAAPLDNVAACRRLLPADHPDALGSAPRRTANEVRLIDMRGGKGSRWGGHVRSEPSLVLCPFWRGRGRQRKAEERGWALPLQWGSSAVVICCRQWHVLGGIFAPPPHTHKHSHAPTAAP